MSNIRLFLILLLTCFSCSVYSQETMPQIGKRIISENEIKSQITYLASDELRGRGMGTEGIKKAANFIAEQFKAYGLKPAGDNGSYFQKVGLESVVPPSAGTITLGPMKWDLGRDFIVLSGNNVNSQAAIVFAGYGREQDYLQTDAKGKYVLILAGRPDQKSTRESYSQWPQKQKIAAEHGALGVIELIKTSGPWSIVTAYMSADRINLKQVDNTGFFYAWINDSEGDLAGWAEGIKNARVKIQVSGISRKDIPAWNVIGIAEGRDTKLRNEYVVASAHYDHLGVGRPVEGDSIYNGARDNAMGVSALMESAKFISESGSERSVLFLACTAEEEGMLGSKWYVNHPVVPLNKTVFNLNTDGAGYDDTASVSLIDPKRTTVDSLYMEGAHLTGLKVTGDPAPAEEFYERSDNISFARKGVPAIDVCPGITGISETIMKYYHQPQDEAESLDYHYATRYVKAYCYTLKLISDSPKPPFWIKGDPYEKAGLTLYGKAGTN